MTPRHDRPATPMTADRWRAVDAILQDALGYDREHREAFVAGACRDDFALRYDVASLLAAHDAAPVDFLERPAFESLALAGVDDGRLPHDTPEAPPDRAPTKRMVTAQAALYAATGVLLLGLFGGWALGHVAWRPWGGAAPSAAPSGAIADVQATSGGTDGLALLVVDRGGRTVQTIAADRPWTPRFSPDGRRVAYGAYGDGRQTSDLWVTDLSSGTARRLTDDDGDSNDPAWSPDGGALAYSLSANGGKDVAERPTGDGAAHLVATRPGTQFPSDWRHDGSVLLVTEEAGDAHGDVLVQPDDGSAARPYAATGADERSARFSPDGRWVAYTSDQSGRQEVYVDRYPTPGHPISISSGGGADPVWRADGTELYYWRGDDLVAVRLDPGSGKTPPVPMGESVLFRAQYQHSLNTMYDASPDGQRFVVVVHH